METYLGKTLLRPGKKMETVVDVYKTYNDKGELVDTKLVTVHLYMGQEIKNYNVPVASLARYETKNIN